MNSEIRNFEQMIYAKIKSNYSNIVYLTESRDPNYEEIKFQEFLLRKYNKSNLFHENLNIKVEIDEHLNQLEKNFDKNNLFKKIGIFKFLEFEDLKYYQPGVGISGKQKTKVDTPVLVVKYQEEFILYDGYHRTLLRIINNETKIESLVIDLDETLATR